MNKLKLIPIELKIYIIFCILVSLISRILTAVNREVWEKFIPFTGWSADSPYFSSLLFSIFVFFQKTHFRFNIYKIIASSFLILYIYHGIQGIRNYDGVSYNNPYLEVSQYRFVWVILIPVFWISVFVITAIVRHVYDLKTKNNLFKEAV